MLSPSPLRMPALSALQPYLTLRMQTKIGIRLGMYTYMYSVVGRYGLSKDLVYCSQAIGEFTQVIQVRLRSRARIIHYK